MVCITLIQEACQFSNLKALEIGLDFAGLTELNTAKPAATGSSVMPEITAKIQAKQAELMLEKNGFLISLFSFDKG